MDVYNGRSYETSRNHRHCKARANTKIEIKFWSRTKNAKNTNGEWRKTTATAAAVEIGAERKRRAMMMMVMMMMTTTTMAIRQRQPKKKC